MLCLSLLTGIFIFHFVCVWRVNVTSIFLCFSLLSVIFTQLFFMFHLPYIDVYFNLPISKIIHIYIYTFRRLIPYMYMWKIFEIGRLKYVDIHVGKVKHKNNYNFYLLYLNRTSSVRLIAIKLHWYVLKMFYYH